jgi:hypothetical protein
MTESCRHECEVRPIDDASAIGNRCRTVRGPLCVEIGEKALVVIGYSERLHHDAFDFDSV